MAVRSLTIAPDESLSFCYSQDVEPASVRRVGQEQKTSLTATRKESP